MSRIIWLLLINGGFLLCWSGGLNTPPDSGSARMYPYSYPEHLTGAYTGGFGEDTCHSCHFDYDLNTEGGSLQLSGFPDSLIAGGRYELLVRIDRADLGRAGFQMSARHPDGNQAGTFLIIDDEKEFIFTATGDSTLQYIQHTATSSLPHNRSHHEWIITWKAPDTLKRVIFNIAANAANGDMSEFGDYIFTAEHTAGQ